MRTNAMRAMQNIARASSRRCLHQSARRSAITNLQMPAMSPTMTEGGISSWKKKEGEAFAVGDVLLEIETDKATIDVEAQDDGVMGKILAPDGTKNVEVGKVIALLAEEGDDISNLETPKEESKLEPKQEAAAAAPEPSKKSDPPRSSPPSEPESAPKPPAATHAEHSGPIFPSVSRLLALEGISDPSVIKGTGVRGMLTKGDVLAYLGRASGPLGTFKEVVAEEKEAAKAPEVKKPLDGDEIRRLIVSNMLSKSLKARNPPPAYLVNASFDSIISDYLPTPPPSSAPLTPTKPPSKSQSSVEYLDGLI
ncbi:single hybrid motif-containing protein [Pterulicium gracile]|uniref:Single hybrid motif-containing protein n=1 Tax=Pterulicium gracile TaxID=1884261 RepID=A0A5C3R0Q8_9AGAR|nr:single hybrid motif-containing protein [Pterula gracilis]